MDVMDFVSGHLVFTRKSKMKLNHMTVFYHYEISLWEKKKNLSSKMQKSEFACASCYSYNFPNSPPKLMDFFMS